MNTSVLKEFILLAQIGNYGAAADPLAVSEATLSRHIMSLEKELGATLFLRRPRCIELTDAGALFLPYAEKIVAAEDGFLLSLKQRHSVRRYSLSIGLDESLGHYGVSDVLGKFRDQDHNISLFLQGGESFSLREQLASGQIQFAFLWNDPACQKSEFRSLKYTSDHLCVVMWSTHPLAAQKRIHLANLRDECVLLPPPLTVPYELCMKAFRAAGTEPEHRFTLNLANHTAAELVRNRFGVAVLPRRIAAAGEGDGLVIRECISPHEVAVSLLFREGAHSQTEQTFIDFLLREGYCYEN